MRDCLIVASNFPPIQSAGVYRTLRLVKYLPNHGWRLKVLTLSTDTLLPNATTDFSLLDQIAKDIEVYRAPARFPIETFNRVTGRAKRKRPQLDITPKQDLTTESAAHDRQQLVSDSMRNGNLSGWSQRLKDRLTIPWKTPDRLIGWVGAAAKLGTQVVRNSTPDLIYSSGPPWSNHLVAGKIVSATGLPWVADFRDPWVGNAFRPNRSGDTWAGRKHRMLEANVYMSASTVIFNTARARYDAIDRIGDSLAKKSVVIPNGFDPEHFEVINTQPNENLPKRTKPIQMIHAGAFYGKRNVDSMLAVIGEMKQAGKLSAGDFQLELIGKIRSHEKSLIEQHSISDLVTQTPPMPHQKCLERLFTADVLLLVQTEAPLCIPGKLYEYVALEKPILTLAAEGSTADLVAQENLGPCIDPADRALLEAGLHHLLQQIGSGEFQQQDRSVRDRYDGYQQMALFDEVFRRAICGRSDARLGDKVS